MKPFNLKEYLKDPSKEVITRDGRAAKIHCTNYKSIQPIIAEIKGNNCSHSFNKDGKYYLNYKQNSPNDLFFAPKKCEGWVNILKGAYDAHYIEHTRIFKSKEDAEKALEYYGDYITTIKIEWEE